MRYQDFYQFMLLFFAFLVLFGVGVFAYKEFFPEYKTYQLAYEDVERFHASYTGIKPAPFQRGIKQILIPDQQNGPEIIDRCITCHVAMDLPDFSPVRVAHDVNAEPIVDSEGKPVLEPNPDYVWDRLDTRIAELRNPGILAQYDNQSARLSEADFLESLQTKEKALQMHPLIGSEVYPFQYHPMEEYGCTSCHSGNGRALEAKRAHGPVYDEDYEPAYTVKKPAFTEKDPENDPPFSRMYNNKPEHDLVFQTNPLLAGDLIVAKCVQCHQSASAEMEDAFDTITSFSAQKKEQIADIEQGIKRDQKALISLLTLQRSLVKKGRAGTLDWLNEELGNYKNSPEVIDAFEGQLAFIERHEEEQDAIREEIKRLVGSEEMAKELMHEAPSSNDIPLLVSLSLQEHRGGALGEKAFSLKQENAVLKRFEHASEPLSVVSQDTELIQKMGTEVDRLILNYNRGKELFVSQACYACHRIAGFSRASIGPELTHAGLSYPWFIKESIVWPQADLPSSTMPNFRLDHEELSDLMTFLMAQTGETKAVSEVDYQMEIAEWEEGMLMPWEKPVKPTDIQNVERGMEVFVSEGCASCHKLEGFESKIGLADEQDREWFYRLIPEHILGSRLAKVVTEKGEEIDEKIISDVREEGIIEHIEQRYPGLIEGFYTNFKFAARALKTPILKERLHRVLMLYIQLYGMGRDIAPHLSWSGVYRDNEWLIGHFKNPAAYTARSIMPVMPFDETKFYMLSNMLHVLGEKNRDALQEIWRNEGFNPPLAFELLCSSCHGKNRQGNGIISEWIYPVPKNLRNPVFLRNLTKERAIASIMHGVQGTPMPPWGESASLANPNPVLTHLEISQLVDWLYQGLPEQSRKDVKEDYEKWSYRADDVLKEVGDDEIYFEVRPNPIPGPDKELYYIKEKYYTAQNLEEAQKLYIPNCAPCHGKDGGGTGLRATSMVEAKPRMLTNLPWLRTRDDLRLLRSIKYGVPGTSMIPWGDQTTTLQQLQLVMYIRSLTRGQVLGDELQEVLYHAFDQRILEIQEARIQEYTHLEKEQKTLTALQEKLYESTDLSPEDAGVLYAKIVQSKAAVDKQRVVDTHYLALIELIKEQKKIFEELGARVIAAKLSTQFVHTFFDVISSEAYLQTLLMELDTIISTYQKKIVHEESKIHYPERGIVIQELMKEQRSYINLRTKLVIGFSEIETLKRKYEQLAQ